jgi:hypothetical protein
MSGLSPHKLLSAGSYTIKKTYKLDLYQENKLKIYTDLALRSRRQRATKNKQSVPLGQSVSTQVRLRQCEVALGSWVTTFFFSSHVIHAAYRVIYNTLR